MGVKGFTSWAKRGLLQNSGRQWTLGHGLADGQHQVLLVDGSALAFFVLNQLGAAARRELGGEYGLIGRAAARFVLDLGESGATVMIVSDGPQVPRSKQEERAKRMQQSLERHFAVYQYYTKGIRSMPENMPPPPLFMDEVYGYLRDLLDRSLLGAKFALFEARGEADVELAQQCAMLRESGVDAKVMGLDSDFFFIRGIEYVPLDEVVITHEDGAPTIRGTVYSAERISLALRVPLTRMADLAVAIGNDFWPGADLDLGGDSGASAVQSSGKQVQAQRVKEQLISTGQALKPRFSDMLRRIDSIVQAFQAGDFSAAPPRGPGEPEGVRYSREMYENQKAKAFLDAWTPASLSAGAAEDEDLESLLDTASQSSSSSSSSQVEQAELGVRLSGGSDIDSDSDNDVVVISKEGLEHVMLAAAQSNETLTRVGTAPATKADVVQVIKTVTKAANDAAKRALAERPWEQSSNLKELIEVAFGAFCDSDARFDECYHLALLSMTRTPDTTFVRSWDRYCAAFGFQMICRWLLRTLSSSFSARRKKPLPHTLYYMQAFFPDIESCAPPAVGLGDAGDQEKSQAQGSPLRTQANKGGRGRSNKRRPNKRATQARPAAQPVAGQAAGREGSRPGSSASRSSKQNGGRAAPQSSRPVQQQAAGVSQSSRPVQQQAATSSSASRPSTPVQQQAAASRAAPQPSTPARGSEGSPNATGPRGTPSVQTTMAERAQLARPAQKSAQAIRANKPRAPVRVEHLPVDDHRSHILQQVARNRVTIIHAETGAGKSTRIPLMLLEELRGRGRIMVSQPRRIAARSLAERIRSVLGPERESLVGLRMGGGVREENSAQTRLWYVTTGYLVRKLSGDPSYFDDFSHLILDEVHERSVDMDILCLMAKRLLTTNPSIKIVLMSATLQAKLFQDYFGVPTPPIFVGAKRYPLSELFLDSPDLLRRVDAKASCFAATLLSELDSLVENHGGVSVGCTPQQIAEAPDLQFKVFSSVSKAQYKICVSLVESLAKECCSAVLIFVSGMANIVELTTQLEQLSETLGTRVGSVVGSANRLRVIPIHGSIPYEEQLSAWDDMEPREMKVVVATNSAESSITLPDVDFVICFGTRRQVEFDAKSQTSRLVDRFISQASAMQRAGRTARTRPGTVFRLYTRMLYDALPPFDLPEIHCSPLDKVVLELKSLVDGPVLPLLRQTVEPPSTRRGANALDSLYNQGLVDHRSDEAAKRTTLGVFVSRLGIDLRLGVLVARGAALGVLAEAVALATVLTATQSPFRVATPLIHKDPAEYHSILSDVTVTKNDLGGGLLSEPLMLVRLLAILQTETSAKFRKDFCAVSGLAWTRMSRLAIQHRHVKQTVATMLSFGSSRDSHAEVELPHPNALFQDPVRLNRVRFLLFASCAGNLVELKQKGNPQSQENVAFEPLVHPNVFEPEACFSRLQIQIESDSQDPVTVDEIESLFPSGVEFMLCSSKVHRAYPLSGQVWMGSSDEFQTDLEGMLASLIPSPATIRSTPLTVKARQTTEAGRATAANGADGGHLPWMCKITLIVRSRSVVSTSGPGGFYHEPDYSDESDYSDSYDEGGPAPSASVLTVEKVYDALLLSDELVLSFDTLVGGTVGWTFRHVSPGVEIVDLGSLSPQARAKAQRWFVEAACPRSTMEANLTTEVERERDGFRVETKMTSYGGVALDDARLVQALGHFRLSALPGVTRTGWRKITHWTTGAGQPSLFIRNDQLEPGRRRMIDDIPLGLKLLRTYAAGNRGGNAIFIDKKRGAGAQGGQGRRETPKRKLVLPAAVGCRAVPVLLSVPPGLGPDSHGEANVFVKNPGVRSVWLARDSFEGLTMSVNCSEPERIFAVADSVTMVVSAQKQGARHGSGPASANVSGLTVLPNGAAWLLLALSCLGVESHPWEWETSLVKAVRSASEAKDLLVQCREFSRDLWKSMLNDQGSFEEDVGLVRKLNHVFRAFTFVPNVLPASYLSTSSQSAPPNTPGLPDQSSQVESTRSSEAGSAALEPLSVRRSRRKGARKGAKGEQTGEQGAGATRHFAFVSVETAGSDEDEFPDSGTTPATAGPTAGAPLPRASNVYPDSGVYPDAARRAAPFAPPYGNFELPDAGPSSVHLPFWGERGITLPSDDEYDEDDDVPDDGAAARPVPTAYAPALYGGAAGAQARGPASSFVAGSAPTGRAASDSRRSANTSRRRPR